MDKLPLDKIIRYGYTGFLAVFLLYFNDKNIIKTLIDSLTPSVAILAILASGCFIYILYRNIIGEFILFPFVILLHKFIRKDTSGLMFIKKNFGISSVMRYRNVYNSLRRRFFTQELQAKLDFAHSELHLMYVSSIVLLIEFFIGDLKLMWLVCFFVLLIFSITLDIRQHAAETNMLKTTLKNYNSQIASKSLDDFLKDEGLL